MEIKDYISNTIEQISIGIIEAKNKCAQYGVVINPDVTIGGNGDFYIPKSKEHVSVLRRVQILDLDIAVTVNETESGQMGAKLGLSCIGVGGNATESQSSSNVNRVKFSIPVCLPSTPIEECMK